MSLDAPQCIRRTGRNKALGLTAGIRGESTEGLAESERG
jgi:hypothetical protein